jgi:hypothetical protein
MHPLLQTYLTLLGSTVLIPFICVPPMGGSPTGEQHSTDAATKALAVRCLNLWNTDTMANVLPRQRESEEDITRLPKILTLPSDVAGSSGHFADSEQQLLRLCQHCDATHQSPVHHSRTTHSLPVHRAAATYACADLANVICTIFFVSGIITLLQTYIGDR